MAHMQFLPIAYRVKLMKVRLSSSFINAIKTSMKYDVSSAFKRQWRSPLARAASTCARILSTSFRRLAFQSPFNAATLAHPVDLVFNHMGTSAFETKPNSGFWSASAERSILLLQHLSQNFYLFSLRIQGLPLDKTTTRQGLPSDKTRTPLGTHPRNAVRN